ncbi:M14 family metallopeptidase [Robertkochia flava]|uniref:M14 family metallopeptidase n=1 Tax=Robertkochia flava TaxID=3447986 RepID=UPI001CCBFCF2|nr:M14 metallopeptidase family protein [Robertkochia marina]
MKYSTQYISSYVQDSFSGRYLNPEHLEEAFASIAHLFVSREMLGTSVEGRNIEMIRIGNGPVRVLLWSQMHGNESTTTRGLYDFLKYLNAEPEFLRQINTAVSLFIIPQLNPDGAHAYTRVNANKIDLNRDAQDLSQPESKALRMAFEKVQPDYCFNLHDQRTIFSAGDQREPATISFLSPAFNEDRDVNGVREISMSLISAMNSLLQQVIPGKVGRYDDAFNLNCVGDTFQFMGVPTVLFEAGHFELDYQRLETRKFIAFSLCAAIETISMGELSQYDYRDYFKIPENKKRFADLILRNVQLKPSGSKEAFTDLVFQYREELRDGQIRLVPEFKGPADQETRFGHKEMDMRELPAITYHTEKELKEKATRLLSMIK